MADDFDDGKGNKKDSAGLAQFENAINGIKSQIRSTNPAELARLNASITSLLSSNLPSEILSKLKDLQAVVSEREEQAEKNVRYTQEEQSREAEEARLLQEQIEFLEKEAHIANGVREQELKQHFEDFDSIKGDAHKQNQQDIALLAQAAKDPNSLTAAQRAQLMGQYATDEEKEEAEKKRQQMKKYCETYYAIKNKTNDTVAYKQSKIKANDAIINHPNTLEPEKKKRRQENAVLDQDIVNHQQKLEEYTTTFSQDREQERKVLLALVNSSQPELAIDRLKRHYKCYEEGYEQERQQNPNHRGYQELQSMVMAMGGHEKLVLPKPKYPIAEQPMPSLPNIKSSSAVVQHQAKIINNSVHTTPTPEEQAKAIRKQLEYPVVKDESKKTAAIGVVANQQQLSEKPKTTSTMSKFSQRAKIIEGRG